MNDVDSRVVIRLNGSILPNTALAFEGEGHARIKSPTELEVMRGLKKMLDPKGIFNPGRVLPD